MGFSTTELESTERKANCELEGRNDSIIMFDVFTEVLLGRS